MAKYTIKRKRNYRSKQKGRYRQRKRVIRKNRRHTTLVKTMTQFPAKIRKEFTWTDTTTSGRSYTISIGAWADTDFYNLNNLYAPNSSVGGPALIPSLSEMASLYNNCKVIKCKLNIKFFALQNQSVAETGNQPLRVFIVAVPFQQTLPLFGTAATTAQMEEFFVGNPSYCRTGYLQSWGDVGKPCVTLNKTYIMKRLYGNSVEYSANSNFDQPIPAASNTLTVAPTNNLQAYVGINVLTPTAATTAITIIMIPTFRWTVEFWNRKGQLS
nr:MAG: capsid protein [Cressdnaviricota sp.]